MGSEVSERYGFVHEESRGFCSRGERGGSGDAEGSCVDTTFAERLSSHFS